MNTAPQKSSLEIQKRFPENLPPGWRRLLEEEKEKPYFKKLGAFLKEEYQKKKAIFPRKDRILRALQLTDFDQVRVVILGQDPYHGEGQAVGLCFAVPNELQPKPPSLLNIFKELERDIGFKWNAKDSELTGWARQGVLLLNVVLSVEKNKAFSHRNRGWEIFTDRIISLLSERHQPIVFLLWGSAAQKKEELIDKKKHFILKAAHPSPLSAHRGFFGCGHFSKANQLIEKIYEEKIDWTQINE